MHGGSSHSKALEESPKQRHQRLEQAERAGEVLVDASWMFSENCFLALQSQEISPPKGGLWLSLLPQTLGGGRVLDTGEGSPYPWKTSYLLCTESSDTHPQIFMPKHYDSDLNYPHKIMFEYLALSFRHHWEGWGWQWYITEGEFWRLYLLTPVCFLLFLVSLWPHQQSRLHMPLYPDGTSQPPCWDRLRFLCNSEPKQRLPPLNGSCQVLSSSQRPK